MDSRSSAGCAVRASAYVCVYVCARACAAAAEHADNNVCSDYRCNKRQGGDRVMCGEAEGGMRKNK